MRSLYTVLLLTCFYCTACGQRTSEIVKAHFNDYQNMDDFKARAWKWTTMHSTDWYDINNNGRVDSFELFKKVAIVPDPAGANNKVLMVTFHKIPDNLFEQYKSDKAVLNQMRRAEIGSARGKNARDQLVKPDQEYDFSLKIYIPSNGFQFEDKMENSRDIVAQFHEVNADEADSPPLSLQIRGNHWSVGINRINNKAEMDYIDLGAVDTNQWTTWDFKVRFSTSNNGYINVSKNNTVVYTEHKANLKQNTPQYIKFGIYKPDWWRKQSSTNLRTLYFDDVSLDKID